MNQRKIGAALLWAGMLIPTLLAVVWAFTGQSYWFAAPLAVALVAGLTGVYLQHRADESEAAL